MRGSKSTGRHPEQSSLYRSRLTLSPVELRQAKELALVAGVFVARRAKVDLDPKAPALARRVFGAPAFAADARAVDDAGHGPPSAEASAARSSGGNTSACCRHARAIAAFRLAHSSKLYARATGIPMTGRAAPSE